MKKKGISPLIATVLIIGFTVALAAIIITWSTSFTKKMQTQTEETANIQVICATDVIFDIQSICYEDEVAKCTPNTNKCFKVLIKNDGQELIKGWKVRIYKDENVVHALDRNTTIEAFGINTLYVSEDENDLPQAKFGSGSPREIRQVEVFPIITRSNKDIICSQNTDSYGDAGGSAISTAC